MHLQIAVHAHKAFFLQMHHSCLISTAIQQSVLLLFNRMGDNDTVGGYRYKNSCVER